MLEHATQHGFQDISTIILPLHQTGKFSKIIIQMLLLMLFTHIAIERMQNLQIMIFLLNFITYWQMIVNRGFDILRGQFMVK